MTTPKFEVRISHLLDGTRVLVVERYGAPHLDVPTIETNSFCRLLKDTSEQAYRFGLEDGRAEVPTRPDAAELGAMLWNGIDDELADAILARSFACGSEKLKAAAMWLAQEIGKAYAGES